MHFVFASVGSLGDLFPLIAIARGLSRKGHSIEFVAEALYENHVSAEGFGFTGVGDSEAYAREQNNPMVWRTDSDFVAELAVPQSLAPQLAAISKAAAHHGANAAVICIGHAVGALWAAKINGLPCIGVVYSNPLFNLYLSPRPSLDIMLRGAFRTIVRDDLPPPVYDYDRTFYADYITEYDAWLPVFPTWFCEAPQTSAPQLEGHFPLVNSRVYVPEIERFVKSGPKPWVFYPGSGGTITAVCPQFQDIAVQACEMTGKRGIIIDRFATRPLTAINDDVVVTPFSGFDHILPSIEGLVHHGGVNTMASALASATPQVILPVAWDQPGNARWVSDNADGITLDPRKLTAAGLARAMDDAAGSTGFNRSRIAAKFSKSAPIDVLANSVLSFLKARGFMREELLRVQTHN